MVKEFFLRKMLEKQLSQVPADQREKLIAMVTKNPELFQKIAAEAQEKMKSGMDQMAAMMAVMQAHQAELAALVDSKQ